MRIFLYEYVTGGGAWLSEADEPPCGSLLDEGAAMLAALGSDLLAGGLDVVTLCDARLPAIGPPGCQRFAVTGPGLERAAFDRALNACDAAWLVAPEFDSLLAHRAGWVEAAGKRLVSPSSEFVAWAASKHRTARTLADAGIRVPVSRRVVAGETLPGGFPYPAVLKPDDGAGSLGVRLVTSPSVAAADQRMPPARTYRLESYVPGTPASVALLCGPRERVVLPPFQQLLSDDGRFTYLGGRSLLHEPERSRAIQLAERTAAMLPETVGYVGIDLVLGRDAAGWNDVVIEINPRLTTSYVGLRRLVRGNLAAAVLDVAAGRPVALSLAEGPIEFAATGICK